MVACSFARNSAATLRERRIAGYRYYTGQKRSALTNIEREISAIADLKVQQIVSWCNERNADAGFAALNPLFNAHGQAAVRELRTWLEAFRSRAGYAEVALADQSGNILISASDRAGERDHSLAALAQEALRSGRAVASDLYQGHSGSAYMDFVMAVQSPAGKPGGRVAVLQVDATAFLSMAVQNWPSSSRTAESMLVRKEGGQVRFLHNLRSDATAAFRLLPLRPDSPAAMAAQGIQGVHQGVDDRGVEVVAALRSIPGTTWFLIAKEDAAEIYAPVRERSLTAGLIVALVMLSCLGCLGLFWHRLQAGIYKRQYQAELERRAIADRYALLSRNVNDVVLVLNESGRIVETIALSLPTAIRFRSCCSSRFAICWILRKSDVFFERWRDLEETPSDLFEVLQRRKDGTPVPVEISSRLFNVDGCRFRHCIIRDVSLRKQDQEKLRRSSRAMRVLSASNQAVIRAGDENDLYRDICSAITDTGGYPLAWIGFREDDDAKSVRRVAESVPEAVTWKRWRSPGPRGPAARARLEPVFERGKSPFAPTRKWSPQSNTGAKEWWTTDSGQL